MAFETMMKAVEYRLVEEKKQNHSIIRAIVRIKRKRGRKRAQQSSDTHKIC